jgi:hypothetical protein
LADWGEAASPGGGSAMAIVQKRKMLPEKRSSRDKIAFAMDARFVGTEEFPRFEFRRSGFTIRLQQYSTSHLVSTFRAREDCHRNDLRLELIQLPLRLLVLFFAFFPSKKSHRNPSHGNTLPKSGQGEGT